MLGEGRLVIDRVGLTELYIVIVSSVMFRLRLEFADFIYTELASFFIGSVV